MRVAIMGAGALGCYIGGRLAAAGRDVSFVARGAQLAALGSRGLRIESRLGNLRLDKVVATCDPAQIGTVDLVLFLVKLFDTETAAKAMAPLLGRETSIISFQNGVDGCERIGLIAGKKRVLGGVALVPAGLQDPGIVRHKTGFANLIFGEFGGGISERSKSIERTLDVPGLESRAVRTIEAAMWEKFVLFSALSGMTGLTRLPIGRILADPLCADLYRRALDEAAQVGLRKCGTLCSDVADRQWAFSQALPPTTTPSMLDDLEHGKRLELNDLSGAVVRLGREMGIETPVHAVIQAALQPNVMGRVSAPSGTANPCLLVA